MTLIQPNKSNPLLNKILAALITLSFISAAWLVFEYNSIVDLNHGIADMNATMEKNQVQNAELNQEIYSFFDSANLTQFAADHNLVKDQMPHYLELASKVDR